MSSVRPASPSRARPRAARGAVRPAAQLLLQLVVEVGRPAEEHVPKVPEGLLLEEEVLTYSRVIGANRVHRQLEPGLDQRVGRGQLGVGPRWTASTATIPTTAMSSVAAATDTAVRFRRAHRRAAS